MHANERQGSVDQQMKIETNAANTIPHSHESCRGNPTIPAHGDCCRSASASDPFWIWITSEGLENLK